MILAYANLFKSNGICGRKIGYKLTGILTKPYGLRDSPAAAAAGEPAQIPALQNQPGQEHYQLFCIKLLFPEPLPKIPVPPVRLRISQVLNKLINAKTDTFIINNILRFR